MNDKKIILASTSPRRSEILTLAGIDFQVAAPECDEKTQETAPEKYVMELSRRKALAGFELCKDPEDAAETAVIGADTIVYFDGKILGKPSDEAQALEMLKALSGNTHEVYTGVTVATHTGTVSFFEKTDVVFYETDEADIREYIKTKEPMDKAGAYGIQGRGCFLVKKINGDYFNVMGLPIAHLLRVLKEIGC